MDINFFSSVKSLPLSKKKINDIVVYTKKKIRSKGDAISIHFVGETRMRTMNRVYRGVDRPTDVLSFPADTDMPHDMNDIGDILLCVPYIKKQAKRFNTSMKKETTRMLVHGILHLHGYDHHKKKDAEKMFSIQESIVDQMS